MSTRSICEFNHDYVHEIAKDPEGFVKALRLFLNGPGLETAEKLEPFGVMFAVSAHHSDDRHAVVNEHAYEFMSSDIKRRRRAEEENAMARKPGR